jgi:hypothetical protein
MKHKRPTVGLMCAFVAVGCLLVGQGQPAHMAAAQGTRWSIVPSPSPGKSAKLMGVTSLPSGEV